jgi:hypothetical protein
VPPPDWCGRWRRGVEWYAPDLGYVSPILVQAEPALYRAPPEGGAEIAPVGGAEFAELPSWCRVCRVVLQKCELVEVLGDEKSVPSRAELCRVVLNVNSVAEL